MGTPKRDDAPAMQDGKQGWFLNKIGDGFVVLTFGRAPTRDISVGRIKARVLVVGEDLVDDKGVLTARYDGEPGTTYLIRPDQHVAARWRSFGKAKIEHALARAVGA